MSICMAMHPDGGPACVLPTPHPLRDHRDINDRHWPVSLVSREMEMSTAATDRRYRLTYEPVAGTLTTWENKTLAELLQPNGMVSLLEYMLTEADRRGLYFRLERMPDDGR